MQNTPNFNLPYPEGTDIYNPLTYEPVAIPIIDEAMQDNKVHTVQVAEHNKQGNNHALTREVVDADVFYFIAADDFVDGDTFTVDGNTVTARLSNGQNLQNDAFKINSAVLCILKNNILTVITFNRPIVDAQLSAESTNPVQNKVVAVPITNLSLKVGDGNIPSGLGNNIIAALTTINNSINEMGRVIEFVDRASGDLTQSTINRIVSLELPRGVWNVRASGEFNNCANTPINQGISVISGEANVSQGNISYTPPATNSVWVNSTCEITVEVVSDTVTLSYIITPYGIMYKSWANLVATRIR